MNKDVVKKKGTKILLYLLIIAFILSSIGGIFFMTTNRYNIIIVEDNNVHINEFVKILNDEKMKLYTQDQSIDNVKYLSSMDFMYNQLKKILNTKLIDTEIDNYRIKKPKRIAISTIFKEKAFLKDGKFNIDEFNKVLEKNKITELDYIEMLQDQQTKEFFLLIFDNIIDSNDLVAKKLSDFYNTYKNVKVYSINKTLLKADIEQPTDEDINFYYINNKELFFEDEQRKIDYVIIKKNEFDKKLKNIDSLMAKSKDINELASAIESKVETFGYITEKTTKNIKDFKNIDAAFVMKKNAFSEVESKGEDLYIFSTVDIKERKQLDFESVKNTIKDYLVRNKKNEVYKNIVTNYAKEFKNSKFNENILLNKKFKIKKQVITANNKQNNEFVINVLKSKNNILTNIYDDNENVYFALVLNGGLISKDNKNYTSFEKVKTDLVKTSEISLHQDYLNYLKNDKYKVIVNYELLDYIR